GRSSLALRGVLALSQTSPSQRAARKEEAVLLADAIERLPPDYRDVLVLRHLRGMTFPRVAQSMNRSLASVEKLWARGLARLRRELGGPI
ncbi:MAG: sigma-70 family RNA polymerase sigma factor, partial [Planctomycetota bacterium]